MLKPCRECGQSVAARAKICPSCGVKKPTATNIEVGLDASAAWMFKLGLTLCFLFFFVVACGVLAGCVSPEDDKPASSLAPTSTSSSNQECQAQSAALSVLTPGVEDLFATLARQSSAGDLVGLQDTYTLIQWAMADLPDVTREMLIVCEGHVSQTLLDDARASMREAESSWADIQRVCRSDLAAFGFEC